MPIKWNVNLDPTPMLERRRQAELDTIAKADLKRKQQLADEDRLRNEMAFEEHRADAQTQRERSGIQFRQGQAEWGQKQEERKRQQEQQAIVDMWAPLQAGDTASALETYNRNLPPEDAALDLRYNPDGGIDILDSTGTVRKIPMQYLINARIQADPVLNRAYMEKQLGLDKQATQLTADQKAAINLAANEIEKEVGGEFDAGERTIVKGMITEGASKQDIFDALEKKPKQTDPSAKMLNEELRNLYAAKESVEKDKVKDSEKGRHHAILKAIRTRENELQKIENEWKRTATLPVLPVQTQAGGITAPQSLPVGEGLQPVNVRVLDANKNGRLDPQDPEVATALQIMALDPEKKKNFQKMFPDEFMHATNIYRFYKRQDEEQIKRSRGILK